MGLVWGRVVGSEIIENRDSDGPVRMLQVEITGPGDVQDVEMLRESGRDSNPINGSMALVIDDDPAFLMASAVDDVITPSVEQGEEEIYSHDETPKKLARIHLDEDGNISHELETDDGVIKLAGDSRDASGVDDTIIIDATTDPQFFTWLTVVGGVVGTAPPTTITGKITSGTPKVKLP